MFNISPTSAAMIALDLIEDGDRMNSSCSYLKTRPFNKKYCRWRCLRWELLEVVLERTALDLARLV